MSSASATVSDLDELRSEVADIRMQVSFCNDLTLMLILGFYAVMMAAILLSYIYIQKVLNAHTQPAPIPVVYCSHQESSSIREQTDKKLVELIEVLVSKVSKPQLLVEKKEVTVVAPKEPEPKKEEVTSTSTPTPTPPPATSRKPLTTARKEESLEQSGEALSVLVK